MKEMNVYLSDLRSQIFSRTSLRKSALLPVKRDDIPSPQGKTIPPHPTLLIMIFSRYVSKGYVDSRNFLLHGEALLPGVVFDAVAVKTAE